MHAEAASMLGGAVVTRLKFVPGSRKRTLRLTGKMAGLGFQGELVAFIPSKAGHLPLQTSFLSDKSVLLCNLLEDLLTRGLY